MTRSAVRLGTINKFLLTNLCGIDPTSQLLHDNLPLHKWMNRAMIRISPDRAEGLRIRVIMLQGVGLETSIVRGYRVCEAVLISPLHLCPCRDAYRRRDECEIADIRQACLRFGRGRTILYLDTAEQPVIFNIAWTRYAGREVKSSCIAGPVPIAEAQAPKSWDRNHRAISVLESPKIFSAARVERINRAIAEISHQQSVAEVTEVSGR